MCIINLGDKMNIEDKIKEVLDKIKPFINSDGGDVNFVKYDNGVVYVRLTGACSHCSLAAETLSGTIQNALMMEIPEVIRVENVE
jgi:Fe-S cluster biogenesis protein NfuA